MSSSVFSPVRPFQPLSRALQLGLVLCLSTSVPVWAGSRPSMGERTSAFAELEAEALSKLSREQRHRYFDDLRALQRPQVIEIAMTLLTAELGEGLCFQLSEGGRPLPHGRP